MSLLTLRSDVAATHPQHWVSTIVDDPCLILHTTRAGAAQLRGVVGAEAVHVQHRAPPAGQLPAGAHCHHQGPVHVQAPGERHVGEGVAHAGDQD
jgi:hypothetical protein